MLYREGAAVLAKPTWAPGSQLAHGTALYRDAREAELTAAEVGPLFVAFFFAGHFLD